MSSNRIKQLYGYSVCLITLIVALFSAQSTLEAFLNLNGESNSFGTRISASFDAYLAQNPRTLVPPNGDTPRDTASVETLRRRWEALREDQLADARAQASRSLASSGLLLVLAVGAFAFHWNWLRRSDIASVDRP